eukprot:3064302-Amphidinium_carterae.1
MPGWIRSKLPTVEEESTLDEFLERTRLDEPHDFVRRCLTGKLFTSPLRSVSAQLSTQRSSTTSHCEVWGAGARSTSLRDRCEVWGAGVGSSSLTDPRVASVDLRAT